MIKKTVIGLVVACLTCCAALIFIPALAGVSLFGISLFGGPLSLETILCGGALALLVVVISYYAIKALRTKRTSSCGQTACSATGKCGCK